MESGEAPYWISEVRFREIVDLVVSLSGEVRCRLTIDDGNISDVTIAGPYLAQKGCVAEIFVLTGRIGALGSLDRAALADLTEMGHIIGSHGRDHRDWRRLDAASRNTEILGARCVLQDLTGQAVESAGIPFGAYDRKVLREIRRAGFRRCYSSDGGLSQEGDWPIPRLSIRRDHDLSAIENAILMREPWYATFRRQVKRALKKRIL